MSTKELEYLVKNLASQRGQQRLDEVQLRAAALETIEMDGIDPDELLVELTLVKYQFNCMRLAILRCEEFGVVARFHPSNAVELGELDDKGLIQMKQDCIQTLVRVDELRDFKRMLGRK